MSDKRQTPMATQKRSADRSVLRKILCALTLTIIVVAGVAAFTLRDEIYLARLSRAAYIGVTQQQTIPLKPDAQRSLASFQNGLAVCTENGLEVYNLNGELICSHSRHMACPVVKTAEDRSIAYDLGGTAVIVFNENGLTELENENTLIDAYINPEGYVALTTEDISCKALVTVFDPELSVVYRYYSASRNIIRSTLSRDGKYLTAAAFAMEDGEFATTLITYPLDSQEAKFEISIGDCLPLELIYLKTGEICAVCESKVVFVTVEGESREYSYSDKSLISFGVSQEGFAALALGEGRDAVTLITVSTDGIPINSIDYDVALQGVTAAGNYIAAFSGDNAEVYDKALSHQLTIPAESPPEQVIIRDDGTAYVVCAQSAALYIP